MAACLLAVGLGWQPEEQPAADELRARRLTLVDERGQAKAWLAVEDGAPELVLASAEGREAVRLEVPGVTGKPALYFFDRQEGHQAELAMTQTGPVLHFSDPQRVRLRLATNELNAPLLAVYDEHGNVLLKATKRQ